MCLRNPGRVKQKETNKLERGCAWVSRLERMLNGVLGAAFDSHESYTKHAYDFRDENLDDDLILNDLNDKDEEDFVKDGNEIDFINKFRDQPIKSNSKITFYSYNWTINKQ